MHAKKIGLYDSSKAYYLWKLVSTTCLAVISFSILRYWGSDLAGVLISSVFMALFFQQSGWLAHDFCHHQVFKSRTLNTAVGYLLGNIYQGFSVAWWKQKHCTHHSAPNIHLHDPDINTMPFLAWSEHALEGFSDTKDDQVTEFMIKNQPMLYFPLLSFARLAWALQSIFWNMASQRPLDFPTLDFVEVTTLGIHYSVMFGLLFSTVSPILALVWFVSSQCFCGIFLASVFSLNHVSYY